MKCVACGAENPEYSRFCGSCGAKPRSDMTYQAQTQVERQGPYQPIMHVQRQSGMATSVGAIQVFVIVAMVFSLWGAYLATTEYEWVTIYGYHYHSYYSAQWNADDRTFWLAGSMLLATLAAVAYSIYSTFLMSRFSEWNATRQRRITMGLSMIALALASVTTWAGYNSMKADLEDYDVIDKALKIEGGTFVLLGGAILLVILSAILVTRSRRSAFVTYPASSFGYNPAQSATPQMAGQSIVLVLGFFLLAGGIAVANYAEVVWRPLGESTYAPAFEYPWLGAGVVLAILGIVAIAAGTRSMIRAAGSPSRAYMSVAQPYSPSVMPGLSTEFCTECGSTLKPGSMFCGICGQRQDR